MKRKATTISTMAKKMNDKDWLAKVSLAYKVYTERAKENTPEVEAFINWLYTQYGIAKPKWRNITTML